MYFIDKRIQVICDNLNKLRIRGVRPITDWQYKRAFSSIPPRRRAREAPGRLSTGKPCTGTALTSTIGSGVS